MFGPATFCGFGETGHYSSDRWDGFFTGLAHRPKWWCGAFLWGRWMDRGRPGGGPRGYPREQCRRPTIGAGKPDPPSSIDRADRPAGTAPPRGPFQRRSRQRHRAPTNADRLDASRPVGARTAASLSSEQHPRLSDPGGPCVGMLRGNGRPRSAATSRLSSSLRASYAAYVLANSVSPPWVDTATAVSIVAICGYSSPWPLHPSMCQ